MTYPQHLPACIPAVCLADGIDWLPQSGGTVGTGKGPQDQVPIKLNRRKPGKQRGSERHERNARRRAVKLAAGKSTTEGNQANKGAST